MKRKLFSISICVKENPNKSSNLKYRKILKKDYIKKIITYTHSRSKYLNFLRFQFH